MSCSSCGTSACSCDPADESLSSALENFTAAFFGTITKTCVNGEVQWVLPCNLDSGISGYPRVEGEGLACYNQRVLAAQQAQIDAVAVDNGSEPSGYVGSDYTQPAEGGSVQIRVIGENGQGNSSVYTVGDTIYIGNGTDGGYYTVTSIDDSSHITIQSTDNISPAGSVITINNTIFISQPTKGFTGSRDVMTSLTYGVSGNGILSYNTHSMNFVNGLCKGITGPNSSTVVAIAEQC